MITVMFLVYDELRVPDRLLNERRAPATGLTVVQSTTTVIERCGCNLKARVRFTSPTYVVALP